MNKIINYIIVSPTDQYGNIQIDYIGELIKDGWQPLGGLCAYNSSVGNNNIYQVMVKYEEK